LEEAIGIKPEFAEPWNGKGNALILLDSYEDTIKSFEEAIRIKPDHDSAWIKKGKALINLGAMMYGLGNDYSQSGQVRSL
jgi:tetratricopeptide (TPR) repeat protein